MTRIRELDGLRGVAILLVLVAHLSGLNGAGLVGVLLFFVLSGFLITRLLVAEHNDQGRIDLRAFYLRRALRLLPALGLLLAVTLALAFVGAGVSDTGSAMRGSLHAALYVTDFVVGLGGEFAPELAHLWTLAVEEQFYVVWPLLILLLMRRGSRASMLRWAGRLLVLAVLARLHDRSCLQVRMVLLRTADDVARLLRGWCDPRALDAAWWPTANCALV